MNLVLQSFRAVVRRWRRNLLTLLALSISAASIAVIVIVAQGSALRVIDTLQDAQSSRITVGLPLLTWKESEQALLERLGEQPGLLSAGTMVLPDTSQAGVSLSVEDSGVSVTAGLAVATKTGLDVRGVTMVSGTNVTSPSIRAKDDRTALLGSRLAGELGVSLEGGRSQVEIDGVPVRVTGVIRDGVEGAALSASVVLSPETAESLGMLPRSRVFILDVEPAVVEQLASIIPYALNPSDPSAVSVQTPPSPQVLRSELLQNANDLVLAVGLILAGVTAFTIVTTMQIAVLERRKEIGISRALGRTRVSVAGGFLVEAAIISTAGTALGLLFGIVVGCATTEALSWTFVVPPVLFLVPGLGFIIGSVAGSWPALQAARMDPAELLRG
jgi:putative ABC transport system permease protein